MVLETEVSKSRGKTNEFQENLDAQGKVIDSLRRDLYKEHLKNISIEKRFDCIEQLSKKNNVRIVDMPEVNSIHLSKQVVELLILPNIGEEDIQ